MRILELNEMKEKIEDLEREIQSKNNLYDYVDKSCLYYLLSIVEYDCIYHIDIVVEEVEKIFSDFGGDYDNENQLVDSFHFSIVEALKQDYEIKSNLNDNYDILNELYEKLQ